MALSAAGEEDRIPYGARRYPTHPIRICHSDLLSGGAICVMHRLPRRPPPPSAAFRRAAGLVSKDGTIVQTLDLCQFAEKEMSVSFDHPGSAAREGDAPNSWPPCV